MLIAHHVDIDTCKISNPPCSQPNKADSSWCSDHGCRLNGCTERTASLDYVSSRYCDTHKCHAPRNQCRHKALRGRTFCKEHACAVMSCGRCRFSDYSAYCTDHECRHPECYAAGTSGQYCEVNNHMQEHALRQEQPSGSQGRPDQSSRSQAEQHQAYRESTSEAVQWLPPPYLPLSQIEVGPPHAISLGRDRLVNGLGGLTHPRLGRNEHQKWSIELAHNALMRFSLAASQMISRSFLSDDRSTTFVFGVPFWFCPCNYGI